MKFHKLNCLFIFSILLSASPCFSQNVVVDLNFDGYNGTVATIPPGYYFSWNSTTTNSFYTSIGNFGVASPSYKFGNDGDFIVTPMVSMADSFSFFSKGNGSPFSPLNELRVSHSTDSINWISDTVMVPLSASGIYTSVPLNQSSGYFRFEYYKSPAGGNLAFDDLKIYSSMSTGLNSVIKNEEIVVYPTPTTGILKLKLINSSEHWPEIEVFDMLGNQLQDVKVESRGSGLFSINLTGKNKGFYFVKIKTTDQFITKRVTLIDN